MARQKSIRAVILLFGVILSVSIPAAFFSRSAVRKRHPDSASFGEVVGIGTGVLEQGSARRQEYTIRIIAQHPIELERCSGNYAGKKADCYLTTSIESRREMSLDTTSLSERRVLPGMDWRNPLSGQIDGLTVFPSGLVAITDTLEVYPDNARTASAACLTVPSKMWTSASAGISTLSYNAGFNNVQWGESVQCIGHVKPVTDDGCIYVDMLSTDYIHSSDVEESGKTVVYGVKISVRLPNIVSDSRWFQESAGSTTECWGIPSLGSPEKYIQFVSPVSAMSLQIVRCVTEGCTRGGMPHKCWPSRISIMLCTDSCMCMFPHTTTTTTPTTSTTTTPTTSTTTTTQVPCTLSSIQTSGYMTTLQDQAPFDMVWPEHGGKVVGSLPGSTVLDPWIRNDEYIRIVLMESIGAITGDLDQILSDLNLLWDQGPFASYMFTEGSNVHYQANDNEEMVTAFTYQGETMIGGLEIDDTGHYDGSAIKYYDYSVAHIRRNFYMSGSRCNSRSYVFSVSDFYDTGIYAAHFLHFDRYKKKAECKPIGTMEKTAPKSIYYVFTVMEWSVSYPKKGVDARTVTYPSPKKCVVQILFDVKDPEYLYIKRVYAMDPLDGSVILDVGGTWPKNILEKELLVVLPDTISESGKQWHHYSWIVVVNKYARPPVVQTVSYGDLNRPELPIEVDDNIMTDASITTWVHYSDCVNQDIGSIDAVHKVLEAANAGDGNPCSYAVNSQCFAQF